VLSPGHRLFDVDLGGGFAPAASERYMISYCSAPAPRPCAVPSYTNKQHNYSILLSPPRRLACLLPRASSLRSRLTFEFRSGSPLIAPAHSLLASTLSVPCAPLSPALLPHTADVECGTPASTLRLG
jgi:hypothetical protein